MGQGQSNGDFSCDGQDVGQTRTNQASYTPQQHQHMQHEQFSGQQKHFYKRRGASTLPTSELLQCLKQEFSSTVAIIQNMIDERNFDAGGRSYICNEMKEVEFRLREFNSSVSPNKTLQTQIKPDFVLQKQQPKGDAKDLTDGNDQRNDGWLVIPSMVRPDTSNKAQSNREKWQKGNPAENNSMNDSEHREQKDVKQLQQLLTERDRELKREEADRRNAIERFNDLKEQFNKLQTDNNELQMRFSKLAGDKLRDNNPAIADLSDPNRPTKIGEMYSEVYDNEWTDAFEALTNSGYDEREAVDTLRLTLLNIIQFCSKKSESLLERTEEAVNILFEEYKATQQMKIKRHLTMPKKASERWGKLVRGQTFDLDDISLQNKWKPKDQSDAKKNKLHKTIVEPNTSGEVIANQLKKFRKEVSVSMVPLVEKAYISASWNEECINDLKPFIRKCLLIGWMMVVQSPPMTLEELKPNEEFRKEIYKSYTKSGSYIDYVVWPALLLNKDGPVVGKGVAQGKKIN